MAFEKYTTLQLKKYNKILLGIGILGLFIMCFSLGIALNDISNQKDSTLVFLIPTVMMPLAMIPLLISASFSREIKMREKHNS